MEQAACPKCSREWEVNCEQHVSVQLFGECIVCRFLPDGSGSQSGTPDDLDRISRRRAEILGYFRRSPAPSGESSKGDSHE